MKTIKFILFTLITSICVVLTSCNSEDDVFNPEPENELKIVGGNNSELPISGFNLLYRHDEIDFKGYGLGWRDTTYPTANNPITVVINSQAMFDAYFTNQGRKPVIDFSKKTVIATKFYSSYYISSGYQSWIKKEFTYKGDLRSYNMNITLETSRYGIVLPATSSPTVMIVISKVQNPSPLFTSVTTRYID